MSQRPRVLIEDWLPVVELGIECRRERAAASALPPLSFLHVWWARRPLVVSAAVAIAGLLPAWTQELADAFEAYPELSSPKTYHEWLLRLVGIWGDPIAARRAYDAAIETGVRIPNPYTYRQAFRNGVPRSDVELLHEVLEHTWGEPPLLADPTAGGGSIPFAATRLGIRAFANDLNGVAAAVLRGGVEIPARESLGLVPRLKYWGEVLVGRVEERLRPFFPSGPNETVATYFFAHTVTCPRTGRTVPLLPDMWLRKARGKEAAVRLLTESNGEVLHTPLFEVLTGSDVDPDRANRGTVGRGDAVSPFDDLAIAGDYIRTEAQEGRLGTQLYAVAVRLPTGDREFRAPTPQDLDAVARAEGEAASMMPQWLREDLVPIEDVPPQHPKYDVARWGLYSWQDFFTPRQLLVHATFADEFNKLIPEVRHDDPAAANDILFLLGLVQGKALNYNSRLSSWHVTRQVMRSVFDTHNFAFKWTFAEFEGSSALYRWSLDQLLDAYQGIALLLEETGHVDLESALPLEREVSVAQGNAADLRELPDGCVTHLCMDPPYYDNVMYAELSDYFFVWEKRTIGRIAPEFFQGELSDKKAEAVANIARFEDAGIRRQELAAADYEAKMHAIFAECHRVLADQGIMTVMFTHKTADAWDSLGMALMESGFTIENSWPVNTESELSLHQAQKNAAASTIMLVCRKRETGDGGEFFEDVDPLVRAEARRALEVFSSQGIAGVDLLLATYGPALSVISSRWPVYSSEADPVTGRSRLLRPEEALDAARAEVTRLQRSRLVGREQSLDPITDFVMVAWDTFKAVEFPFDEARRLALAIGGLDIEELRQARVLDKKSGTVVLLPPSKRVRRESDMEAGLPGVYPEATGFTIAVDGVHTAIYIADVDGLATAKVFLDRAGLTTDPRFLATFQGLVNAMPRSKVKGEWVVPEAGTLDRLSAAYFPNIELPQEPEIPSFEQASLLVEE